MKYNYETYLHVLSVWEEKRLKRDRSEELKNAAESEGISEEEAIKIIMRYLGKKLIESGHDADAVMKALKIGGWTEEMSILSDKYPEHYGKLLKYFEKTFGEPIPFELPPDLEEVDLGIMLIRNVDQENLLGLLQHEQFIEKAQNGAYIIGAWGHGINSYRFVLQFADKKGKFCFEGAVEGFFDPHPETEQKTLNNLLELVKIHKHLKQVASSYEIVHSYGGRIVECCMNSGESIRVELEKEICFNDIIVKISAEQKHKDMR